MCSFVQDVDYENIQKYIESNKITIIVVAAAWKKSSMQLVDEINDNFKLFGSDVEFILLNIDEDDEIEAAALSLNLKEVPSVCIYDAQGTAIGTLENQDATVNNIKQTITVLKNNAQRIVGEEYAATVKGEASCCVSIDSKMNSYTMEQLAIAGKANLGLGCGNPLSFAELKTGEVVVDLGSGAGIDCFIAGSMVGPTGKVIGVDMTPDMIHTARNNILDYNKKMGENGNNVSFRLGEIEYIPVAGKLILLIGSTVLRLEK